MRAAPRATDRRCSGEGAALRAAVDAVGGEHGAGAGAEDCCRRRSRRATNRRGEAHGEARRPRPGRRWSIPVRRSTGTGRRLRGAISARSPTRTSGTIAASRSRHCWWQSPTIAAVSKRARTSAEPIEAIVECAMVEEIVAAEARGALRAAWRGHDHRTKAASHAACAGLRGRQQGGMAAIAAGNEVAGTRGARFRAPCPLRRMRDDHRSAAPVLRRHAGNRSNGWGRAAASSADCRWKPPRSISAGDAWPRPPLIARSSRGDGLWRHCPFAGAATEIFAESGAGRDDGAVHAAADRGRRPGTILVPVPLHRSRLWWRGFNQSGLTRRQSGEV